MNPDSSFPHRGPSQGIFSRLLGMLSRHKVGDEAPEWTATIFTTAESAKGLPKLDFLDLNLVGEHGCIDAEKEGQNLATWQRASWTSLDDRLIGFSYTGKIHIPKAIGTPQVAVFWNTGGEGNPDSFLVSRLVLTPPPEAGQHPITFAVNSNIHHKQGPRIFFDDKPRLPSQTTELLQKYRAAELAELRGTEPLSNPNEWDRVYQFDYFNDLGVPSDKEKVRPVLGGLMYKGDVFDKEGYPNVPEVGSGGKLGFPRRLRTGRGHYGETPYENVPGKEHPEFWVPQDDDFDSSKQGNFDGAKKFYQLSLLNGLIAELAASHSNILQGILAAQKPDVTPFPDFKSVESLFTSPVATAAAKIQTAVAKALATLDKIKLEVLRFAFGVDLKEWEEFLKSTKPGHKLHLTEGPAKIVNSFCKLLNSIPFKVPAVYKDREHLWETDEEWGREAIAGTNPCVIQAIQSIPEGSKVTEQDLKPHLGGHTLEDLFELEAPRLFMIDYSVVYPAYTKLINTKNHDGIPRYQYAGRAYLFLRDDNQLVPVAIELFTGESPAVVYTPSDPRNVWLLVKAVFASIDAGFHQLYSHFARTHACLESSLIAMRRQISAMHPVYKLLMPHFRFMLGINKNGRLTNINSGGFVEKVFTPGKFALTMTAEVYTAVWKFEDQSLPNDLISRKMAKKGEDGKVELLLPDYPYASDGLLVWNSVEKWVSEYLSLYYTGGKGATVTSDHELMAWWEDYRLKGHPDKKEGWPKLESVEDLTQIITTIIWLASAHHAAVNFAQYDYSGYMPNRSTIVHRPIPAKGTEEYEDLVLNLDKTFFATLAKPKEALLNLTAMAVLSTHSDNEEYISDREHFYIFDPKARELWNEHIDEIHKVGEEIENRNRDQDSTARSWSKGGLAYTALLPSSGPGITGRGIPNSITI